MSKKRQRLKLKHRRRLHEKHKRRRKKDTMIGMPLIIGFQGDPAMGFLFRCNEVTDIRGDYHYHLINPKDYKSFYRLRTYLNRMILNIAKQGYILVKDAPKL